MISLDSDDEDVVVEPQRQPSIEIVDNDNEVPAEEEEDDEFAEYIRKAEEEKKRIAEEGAYAHLLVTSEIPGTKPTNFRLKLDQFLVKACDAWVDQQQSKYDVRLPCPGADLILSWRREKIYRHSSLYSLGVRQDPTSSNGIKGVSWKGLSEDRKMIHLEISTPEIFQQWEEEKQREAQKAQESEDNEPAPAVEVDEKLRVVLRARDLEDVRLTVRAATKAETLVEAYRRIRKLGDQSITLWFDGDQLGAETTLEEMDINDMDTIEVHIK